MSQSNSSRVAGALGIYMLVLSLILPITAVTTVAILAVPQGQAQACEDDCGGWDFGDVSYEGSSGVNTDESGWDFGDASYDGSTSGYADESGWNFGDSSYDGSTGYCCESYNNPCDCNDTYSEPDTYDSDYYSQGSHGGGYSGGSSGGFSMPRISYPSTPTTFYAPTYSAPRQQPQQPVRQQQSGSTVINNTNTNVNNNSAVATAIVYPVQSAPVSYPVQYVQPTPVYQPQPSCTITVNRYNNGTYGQYGNQLATLTWTSNYATSGFISPNVGTVSTYGSMTVYPVNGQVYSMTVYGPGGTATCATPAQFAPVVAAPVAPYVSLSQIPYTGLDMSPLAQALYWMGMVAFAGAAAYLVLYFQGGAANVLASVTGRSTRTVTAAPKIQMPTVAVATQVAPAVAQPVVSPIQAAQVSSARSASTDTMKVVMSKGSEAPRIIISRA